MTTSRYASLLLFCLAGCTGCSPSPTPAPADMGRDASSVTCPLAGQTGPCCARVSNAGDRITRPELRIAALRLTKPTNSYLTNTTVTALFSSAFNDERFNWLIQIAGAPALGQNGNLTVRTGYGATGPSGTYAFTMGEPMGTGRWNPVTVSASVNSEVVTASPSASVLNIPIFDESSPPRLQIELPIYGLEVRMTTLTENRSCIGTYGRQGYSTASGAIAAYMLVSDAMTRNIDVDPIHASLCAAVHGQLASMDSGGDYCEVTPRAMWPIKPDSLCTSGVCRTNSAGSVDAGMHDVCDPNSTCNAWRLEGAFAAHGVEITTDLDPDAGISMTDAGPSDASSSDAGSSTDAARTDASSSDAGATTDAGSEDAATADATSVDAG